MKNSEEGAIDIRSLYLGVGRAANTSKAILLLARHFPQCLESKIIRYDYRVHENEAGALSCEEIKEVIEKIKHGKRIKQNSSTLIGDLVKVSRSILSSEEMTEIHDKLKAVAGVDENKSKSCQMISDLITLAKRSEKGITDDPRNGVRALVMEKLGRAGDRSGERS